MSDEAAPVPGSFAEFHAGLGGVALDRILMKPPPGTATERDLVAAWEGPDRYSCELVDGTLILRFGTLLSGVLVGALIGRLGRVVEQRETGVLLPGSVPYRLRRGLIRCPSLTYTPWEWLPGERLPDQKVASFVPGLTIDVCNQWTGPSELDRKVSEYFAAGVRRAWVIDSVARAARVYTSATRFKELTADGVLDGGRVLLGFKLPLADLFAATKRRKKKPR